MNEIEKLPTEMLSMAENALHQLFYSLGVDLDYIPIQKYEAFVMGLQFIGACLFLYMFGKAMFTLLRSGLRGGL
ncbi:MAG: hypothetical protein IJ645_07165 [Ruminococcus sp.]|nr:hypothetical protein [Ruminococcus sp.]